MADLGRLLEAFKSKDIVERGNWLANVLDKLGEHPQARDFLDLIEKVWAEEAQKLPQGLDRDRPDPGLLKAVGYRVGWTAGQPEATRAIIIGFLLSTQHLPPVKDYLYMEEWGTAWSRKRLEKFTRVLSRFIEDAAPDPRKDRAIADWQFDIRIAELAWSDKQAEN